MYAFYVKNRRISVLDSSEKWRVIWGLQKDFQRHGMALGFLGILNIRENSGGLSEEMAMEELKARLYSHLPSPLGQEERGSC